MTINLDQLSVVVEGMSERPWRVTDYTITPTGYPGICVDAWEVFAVNPGAITRVEDAAGIVSLRNNAAELIAMARRGEALEGLLGEIRGNGWVVSDETADRIDAVLGMRGMT
jgi:hypothetical protein